MSLGTAVAAQPAAQRKQDPVIGPSLHRSHRTPWCDGGRSWLLREELLVATRLAEVQSLDSKGRDAGGGGSLFFLRSWAYVISTIERES